MVVNHDLATPICYQKHNGQILCAHLHWTLFAGSVTYVGSYLHAYKFCLGDYKYVSWLSTYV